MKCRCDRRRRLEVFSITFGCTSCHYTLTGVDLDDLTKQELNQIKKDCDYCLKNK